MKSPSETDTVEMNAKPGVPIDREPPSSFEMEVDTAGLSHIGHIRSNNEDHFLVTRFGRFLETLDTNLYPPDVAFREDEVGYCLLVADGMGGHAGGEVASRLAVSTLVKLVLATPDWILRLDDDQLSREVLRRAKVRLGQINTTLVNEALANPALKGLGTTLTFAWNLKKDLIVAHVGDSRAYLYRKQQLHKLTHDHTVAQSLADHGFIAQREVAMHRFHHVLTKALGGKAADMEPDLIKLRIEDGDVLMLCTDGLTDMVSDELIRATLESANDSKTKCKILVEQALDAGGKDNVTVAVARYRFA